MSKQILWVIKQKHNDVIFPTLKAARESTAGCDAWFHGESVRIISRIMLDKISRKRT